MSCFALRRNSDPISVTIGATAAAMRVRREVFSLVIRSARAVCWSFSCLIISCRRSNPFSTISSMISSYNAHACRLMFGIAGSGEL